MSVLSLKPSYYEALRRLAVELVGIQLGDDYAYLIETRLRSLARQEGFTDLTQLIDELFGRGQTRLALKVVSALLERDMHFNADPETLDKFKRHIIPNLLKSGERHVRVLSFGCCSGQEAYSLAMILNDVLDTHTGVRFTVTGIDYPSPAINRAARGVYTHFEVQRGLPIRDLIKNFEREGENWRISETLRANVEFREHHLLSNLSNLGDYHVVVFRNSLPRYTPMAQIRVIRNLASVVNSQGYLLIGSGEMMPTYGYGLEPVPGQDCVYKREAKTHSDNTHTSNTYQNDAALESQALG